MVSIIEEMEGVNLTDMLAKQYRDAVISKDDEKLIVSI